MRNGKTHLRVSIKESVKEDREEILTNPAAARLLQEPSDKQKNSQAVTIRYYPPSGRFFHCYLILGLVGFVVFWLVLMLRIYLPEKYWTWSYMW